VANTIYLLKLFKEQDSLEDAGADGSANIKMDL
jgi:hypothetical protein